MNLSKVFFAALFSILISSFAFANPDTGMEPNESTKTVTTKIKSIIQNLDIDLDQMESKTVKLKFLINDNNEIVVLSTGDSALDGTLKSALNYRVVNAENMKHNNVYILPVKFQ